MTGSRSDIARKKIRAGNYAGLNNMAYIGFRGDPIYHCNQVCFGSLGYHYRYGMPEHGKKVQWFLDWNPRRSKKYPEYVDYVINRSPLAHVFVDKDPKRIPLEPTLYNTKNTTRAIVAGAIMLRYLQEHHDVINWWYQLRETFSEDLAFLIPHILVRKQYTPQILGMVDGNMGFYHSFHSTFNRTRIINWLDHKILDNNQKNWMYYGTNWAYRDLSSLFSGEMDREGLNFPHHCMKTFKLNDVWETEVSYYPIENVNEIVAELMTMNRIDVGGHIRA